MNYFTIHSFAFSIDSQGFVSSHAEADGARGISVIEERLAGLTVEQAAALHADLTASAEGDGGAVELAREIERAGEAEAFKGWTREPDDAGFMIEAAWMSWDVGIDKREAGEAIADAVQGRRREKAE